MTGVDDSRPLAGIGEIDILTGNGDTDRFTLGDRSQVFYNDGNPDTEGLDDYALITDLTNDDVIQLKGVPDDYVLVENFSIGESTGTGIFLKDTVNELIGLAQGVSGLDLNDFSFV